MSKETEQLVLQAQQKGYTKLLIANALSVEWDDVDAWEKGLAEPDDAQQQKLQQLIEKP